MHESSPAPASPTTRTGVADAVGEALGEALGGHGLVRPRKQAAAQLMQRSALSAAPPGVFQAPVSVANLGPAPFVSRRLQLHQPRAAVRSPPRHSAVTIHDPPSQTPTPPGGLRTSTPSAVPARFRAASPALVSALDARRRANESSESLGIVAEPRRRAPSDQRPPPGAVKSKSPPARGPGVHYSRAHMAPPPSSTTLLSSMFVRRKQTQQQRPPEPHAPPGAPTPTGPQMLFFQDTDSETSSQCRHSTRAEDEDSEATTEKKCGTLDSAHSTDDTTDKEEGGAAPSAMHAGGRAHDPRRRRNPTTSHYHYTGIEKLGELSRDEENYDFAILLKPSKVEEHADVTLSLAPEALDSTPSHKTSMHRAASDVQSATAGGDEQQVGAGDSDPFKLVGTPRPQLRKQKNDPKNARAQIVQRILRTGLQVKRLLSLDGKQTLLKVRAPQHVLEVGAERMKLRKLRKFDQIWMEFSCELRETFADFDAALGGVRFIDSEKQSIVHSLLTTDDVQGDGATGAGLNEFCPLKSKYVLKMFPLHKQDDLASLRLHWVTFWRSAAEEEPSRGSKTKRLVTHALRQPIDQVAQYYGERIAYYFAWIEMYTRWLVVPSVAGVLLFILQVQSKTLDHPLASGYAIFMALWTSAFLIAWKRRAATLAYRWGTLGYEDAEITRPEFYGDPRLTVTPTDKNYPAWKRYAKYAVTVPLVIGSIVLVLVLTFYAFSTRDRLEAQSIAVKAEAQDLAKDIAKDLEQGLNLENFKRLTELGMDWDFWFYFLITPMLYGLLIPVLDYAFTRVARRMTNWENHETETRHQSHLILKVFAFRFVHVFASLYYYAFSGASDAHKNDSLLRLAVQLASFMVTDQLWRNAMQTLYPFVMRHVHAQRKKRATNAQFHQSAVFNTPLRTRSRQDSALRNATQPNSNAVIHEQCVRLEQASDHAWEEAELEPYDTFEDYTEMLIQFGYVTFFSLAFPLAPLLALLNNVFEMRMDAFKLCHAKQRPLAHKASGIGVWFHVLQLMSVLAVLTNCLHIAFTTTQIERVAPRITPTYKVWIVFCVEHLILALKVWMMAVIPSTPSDVKEKVRKEREHAKIESARAMAVRIQSQLALIQVHEEPLPAKPKARDEGVRRRSRGSSSVAQEVGTEPHDEHERVA